jgi:multidrug resistance efflux pump
MAQSELDRVNSRQQMLIQDRTKAEVTRDRTLYDIQRTRVSAPFCGITLGRQMNLGEYTSPGASSAYGETPWFCEAIRYSSIPSQQIT